MRGSAAFRTGVAPGGALAPGWVRDALWRSAGAVPSLDLRFADNKSLVDATTGQNLVTFTRASSGTYVGSDGVLKTATTNEPRFDHNPTTGESLGLLVEEQRTNSIRNNTMVGAVAGTPGTLPTNWSLGGAAGLTTSVVGTGTENGVTYIDIRLNGTTSGTFATINFESLTGLTTATTYTLSSYVRIVSGTTANITLASLVTRYNLSPSGNTDITSSFTLQQSALLRSRSINTGTTTGTLLGTGVCFLQLNWPTSAAIDITLRIGLPQLEQGAFATSVIPTSGAAATRSADVASITGTNFSSWYRQDEGTVFADASSYMGAAAVSRGLVSIDGAAGDVHRLFRQSDLQPVAQTLVSSVAQSTFGFGATWSTSAAQRLAYAYAANNFGGSINGGAAQTDSSGTIPTTNTLNVGSLSGGSYFGGTIRRLTYWPARLDNSKLQTITQ